MHVEQKQGTTIWPEHKIVAYFLLRSAARAAIVTITTVEFHYSYDAGHLRHGLIYRQSVAFVGNSIGSSRPCWNRRLISRIRPQCSRSCRAMTPLTHAKTRLRQRLQQRAVLPIESRRPSVSVASLSTSVLVATQRLLSVFLNIFESLRATYWHSLFPADRVT